MELKFLSATFGRLKNDNLAVSPGLNVIEAVNESGKSTWMAFIRVMLYGLSTRDRGPLADKHRYMPWDGSPMQGSMDLFADGQGITVTRSTARPTAPMGSFSACFTGTSTSVPLVTATTLGESLIGVPQDVFERSAFIRQSGVSIDQSPALEQRIAALITTGEEDTSYTDAADRLRRQLNRRRYHRNGQLPQLESEIDALEDSLSEIAAAEEDLRALEAEHEALRDREAYLRRQLALCDAAESARQLSRLKAARESLSAARTARDNAVGRVVQIPSRSDLADVAGALSAVQAMDRPVRAARERMQECAAALNQAEQKLAAHPLAPQTPEEAAAAPVTDIPRPRLPVWLCVLIPGIALIAACLLHFVFQLPRASAAGIALLTAGPAAICAGLVTARRQARWEEDTAQKRSVRDEAVAEYTILYDAAKQENATFRAASETYRSLAADQKMQLDRILIFVHLVGPAETVAEAHRVIESALALHTAAENAEQHYQQEKLRFDLLTENAPSESDLSCETPELSRGEAEALLNPLTDRLAELRRAIHTAQGRIAALGDAPSLRDALQEKREQLAALEGEFSALTLAAEVLSDANTALQQRFSPALGEKAAGIFTKLTGGKYNRVLLDRELTPSVRKEGDMLTHTAAALSQGAADQLYLAVRLAICDMVLPEEKRIPIFLDDALVTFDDARMAAALDYLVELSEERQILLFTCQQRELNYLRTAHPGRYHAVKLS